MSSFIVEDNTINRIVNFCFWVKEDCLKYEVNKELINVGIDLNQYFKDDKELDLYLRKFGEELLKMNLLAFYDRYEHIEDTEKEIIDSIKEYEFMNLPLSELQEIQVLKSIECFLYQCYEGNIPEYPLFKALDKIKEHLKDTIINKIPEYQKAIWN